MNKTLTTSIGLFIGLYLFSTGISFALFNYVISPEILTIISTGGKPEEAEEVAERAESEFRKLLDASGPKTEICPLNGKKYSVTEREAWETRRPLLVMIENHEDSRPQSGLSSVDIIYETIAEGGITRFMGVYYCDVQRHEVTLGPVRSARTYFLDWASEYGNNPLYTHVGGANCNQETGSGCQNGAKADALGQINKYGWGGAYGNDLSQFSIGYPVFQRDATRTGREVATEHTVYSSTEKLWEVAQERGWEYEDEEGVAWNEIYVPWTFVPEDEIEKGTTTDISYVFWDSSPAGDFSVQWKYDPIENVYLRSIGGEPHMERNTGEQLAFKNVVVMFSAESRANDGYENNVHLLYELIGEGEAVVFRNGTAVETTWEKASRTDRTIFYDEDGQEIEFVEGSVWISNVPTHSQAELEY